MITLYYLFLSLDRLGTFYGQYVRLCAFLCGVCFLLLFYLLFYRLRRDLLL